MARLYAILGAVLAILEGGGMNTRKGFIREGFGLASILAAQSSPAILVRSMVAARGSFFGRGAGGGGWVNPYVTDGLVAMWDGIWNGGYETHNASATTWKDLAGSNALDCSSNLTWGDNCAQISGDTCFGNDIYDVVGCSIEFVWQDSQVGTTRNYISVGGGAGISSPWYSHTGCGSAAGVNMSNGFSNGNTPSTNKQNIRSYSFVRGPAGNNTLNQYWIDGTRYENLYYYPASFLGSISGVHMMANTGVMKSYCTRIYNRALTAAEVAANNAVDKARFNLP